MNIQNDNGRNDDAPIDDAIGSGGSGEAAENSFSHDEELSLVEDDGPLPWLESDYDEAEEGVDTGRIIGLGLLALLLLALILGVIYYFSNRGPDPELVADGSTIEAPDGPMKTRPEDAGGKEFSGTGDVAPVVGDGQSTEGRLDTASGDAAAAAKPSIDAATSASASTAGASGSASGSANSSGSSQAASTGGVGVQVAAFSTRESAVEGWNRLTRQTDALSGVKYRIEQGQADIGTVFRLQAVASDRAAAETLCRALKADGVACQVK